MTILIDDATKKSAPLASFVLQEVWQQYQEQQTYKFDESNSGIWTLLQSLKSIVESSIEPYLLSDNNQDMGEREKAFRHLIADDKPFKESFSAFYQPYAERYVKGDILHFSVDLAERHIQQTLKDVFSSLLGNETLNMDDLPDTVVVAMSKDRLGAGGRQNISSSENPTLFKPS